MCSGLRRARSSVWLERQAHNLVVKGSNPFGPTKSLSFRQRIYLKPAESYVVGELDYFERRS